MNLYVHGGIHINKISYINKSGDVNMVKTAKAISSDVFLNSDANVLCFTYKIKFSDESVFSNNFTAHYPLSLTIQVNIDFIKNIFHLFLSQLFLCDAEIPLICSLEDKLLCGKIVKALYAIRNYEEGTSLYPQGIKNIYCDKYQTNLSANKIIVMNLISGGKDSLAADLLLEKNGAIIKRCFIDGLNIASSASEYNACISLYSEFDIIRLYGFEKLILELSKISDCYGKPPKKNYIPRGRDILTIALIYPLALLYGCLYISHGCEKDLWEKNIIINDEEIPLHDSQSCMIIEPLSELLNTNTGIHLFSPIAGMHEIYILSSLLINHIEKVKQIQSCFYGEWCGECSKCFRYYLISKYNNKLVFNFKKNPEFQYDAILSRLNEEDADKTLGFYKELLFLTGKIELKNDLFTPIYNHLFPDFFKTWVFND
jgi:hypothetical protein